MTPLLTSKKLSTMLNKESSEKLMKLKVLLENQKIVPSKTVMVNTEKSFNFSQDLSKDLSLYLSIIEKPVNLLFSIDQFLFEFSKKTYQQRKTGEFFQQLKERKKLSLFYGHLSQKQLKNLFTQINKKKGYFSKNILSLLETRLDVVIYRSGLVKTIAEARQLIHHKKIQVNSQKVTVPSYCVNPGDVISLKPETLKTLTHEVVDQVKNKRNFSKFYGDFFSKFKTNFERKLREKFQSKIACNLLIQLLCTRIKLRSFWSVKKNILKENTVNLNNQQKVVALFKWKYSATRVVFQKKQGKIDRKEIVYASGGSLQKKPVFWSYKLTNLKQNIPSWFKNKKIQKDSKNKDTSRSENFNKRNQAVFRDSFLIFLKHLNNYRKFNRLVRLNMKKFLIKRSFYPQKTVFKKILDFRLLKPIHLEISYNLLTIIYLYSPQRINFPFYIDLDLIKRSFR